RTGAVAWATATPLPTRSDGEHAALCPPYSLSLADCHDREDGHPEIPAAKTCVTPGDCAHCLSPPFQPALDSPHPSSKRTRAADRLLLGTRGAAPEENREGEWASSEKEW